MKQTNTLQIKGFPLELNKALKINAVNAGVTFRQYVITALQAALDKK